MKLDKIQILEIFQLERIADDNTGVYNINFQDLLNKLSLPTEKKSYIKSLYENQNLYTEKEHLNKVASLLDFQIEMFSDDFWEIFFFRKHAYLSSYKERKWNEFNESYESVKDVKKKVKVLKSLNISLLEFENFISKLSYVQDTYVDFWCALKKKNKDNLLTENFKKIIFNYGSIDERVLQKSSILSYFQQIEELENLYEKNKNSPYKREIENEIKKFKTFENHTINLFEEMQYHQIIYKKSISINENSLIYELKKDKKTIEKIVNIIGQFLNREIYQIKSERNDSQYQYTIEAHSEENLNEKIKTVKQAFTHLPELLLKENYIRLFKEDTYVNEEINQFFRQYIKSANLYKNLDNKLPEQNNKIKKNKI